MTLGSQKKCGTGSLSVLPELYLAHTALRIIYVFRAEFGEPFNTIASSGIYTHPVDIG